MQELWQAFGDKIQSILPASPFAPWIEQMETWPALAWLNWLIPVGDMVKVFGAWLGCVAIFYLAQVVLRWVKVIQG